MNKYFLTQKEINCFDTGESCIGYNEYLKSRHWIRIRHELLKIHNSCQFCGNKKESYDIHHLHYKTLGKEDISKDLCVLCADCHKLIHSQKPGNDNFIFYLKPPKKQQKKKVKLACKNCRYSSWPKISNKNTLYCNILYITNPQKICEKFKKKRRIRIF